MIEINKLKSQTQRYDAMFGTRSRIFPPDIILVSTSLDSWQIIITNKQKKPICLLHQNKFGRINRYHVQAWKTCLYHAYHSIYTHKNPLLYKKNNYTYTYTKGTE
jgi:hypothetical protein